MARTEIADLDGTELRYNGDTWLLTGVIDVIRNGEGIDAEARKSERVRGNRARLQFSLQEPPASINPGNPGDLDVAVERGDGGVFLVVHRPHTTDRYRLESVAYN